ncbi:hypothetical protein ABZ770_38805 [Streptomyces sp. NPDC006654]|uniref:hypothetical protein n=1 Tax=unclassified Streptomyces TaxID=2593676 RepID=UPI0033E42AFF
MPDERGPLAGLLLEYRVVWGVRPWRHGEPGEFTVCDGHAMAARASITDGQVVPGLPA